VSAWGFLKVGVIVMPLALLLACLAIRRGIGRKKIFLVAFLTLPIRGFLFTLTDSPYGVVAIQLLDGVAAGIFGVISIIIAADLMRVRDASFLLKALWPCRQDWARPQVTSVLALSFSRSVTPSVSSPWPGSPSAASSSLPY
jgi:hypothetical protein